MCFRKKKNLDDATVAERAKPYLEGQKRLNDLDFEKFKDIEVLRYCLDKYPKMALAMDLDREIIISALTDWLKGDYFHDEDNAYKNRKDYCKYLDSQLNNPKLLLVYLDERFKDTITSDCEGLTFSTSYNGNLVFNYKYETKKGETISYFDTSLELPTSLVTTAVTRLKMIDGQKLVEKIDIDIHYIDTACVLNHVTSTLNKIVRDTILEFIVNEKLTFYSLPQYYSAINKAVLEKMQVEFNDCGFQATDFSIMEISILDGTDKLLRNQFYAIAEAKKIKTYEQEMEKISLDLYERKADIHSKYPDFPMTLTEAEKDFALNRYMTRSGYDMRPKANLPEKEIEERKVSNSGEGIKERRIALPTFIKKMDNSRYLRIAYFAGLIIAYVIAFSLFAVSLRASFSALAIVTLIFGLLGFKFFNVLKRKKSKGATKANNDTPYDMIPGHNNSDKNSNAEE